MESAMGGEPIDLLREDEAAARLGMCARTLRKARQRGDLNFIKYGRIIRYHPDDLAAFIESVRQCQSASAPIRHTGGIRSPSEVVDFVAAREKRRSARLKK